MRHDLLFGLLSLAVLVTACASNPSPSAGDTLRAQLDADWKYWMGQYPELATAFGYPGQNARWTDYSQPALEARAAYLKDSLGRFSAIDRAQLTPDDRVSYDLYRDLIETTIEEAQNRRNQSKNQE